MDIHTNHGPVYPQCQHPQLEGRMWLKQGAMIMHISIYSTYSKMQCYVTFTVQTSVLSQILKGQEMLNFENIKKLSGQCQYGIPLVRIKRN